MKMKQTERKREQKENSALAEEIRRVQEILEDVLARLDRCGDPRLLEAAAWELKYYEAKSDWLYARARATGCRAYAYFK